MRTILKVATIAVLSAIALIVFAVAATLGYRADLQHHNAQAFAIHTPNGIDEAMYVKIGGIDQWVQIRGQNRNNPVILMLHGGPGASWLPLTALFVPWEKDFTVVQWDQRGAGKTLETTGDSVAETMSIDRMTQFGLEVS
jgi:pimeloyl-ACP methyl ester carboxylesterase